MRRFAQLVSEKIEVVATMSCGRAIILIVFIFVLGLLVGSGAVLLYTIVWN